MVIELIMEDWDGERYREEFTDSIDCQEFLHYTNDKLIEKKVWK
ncbi:hypothetical protein Goe5_c02730 [Bacillus phage vB_BthM-Goe5]|nr:hypothetical protein Goe5_c00020 [Bacillus phage vB_BthM-Goe5]AZF89379.1 hypothetical protein Goe5_c02730 [Bacillus phage vB_BthM-Goe5]